MSVPIFPASPARAALNRRLPLNQSIRSLCDLQTDNIGDFGRYRHRNVDYPPPQQDLTTARMVQSPGNNVLSKSNALKQTQLPSGLAWMSYYADMMALAVERGISRTTISNGYQFRLKEAARTDKSRYWGECPEVQQAAAESETWKHFCKQIELPRVRNRN
jgi:hypothetical protein